MKTLGSGARGYEKKKVCSELQTESLQKDFLKALNSLKKIKF